MKTKFSHLVLALPLTTSTANASPKEQTLETIVTCTEANTDYNYIQVAVVVPDGPMPYGLVVEVNEDDGLSRNLENRVFNSLKTERITPSTTRYTDKYEYFDLRVEKLPNGKLKGTFFREVEEPESDIFENMNCVANSTIKVLIP